MSTPELALDMMRRLDLSDTPIEILAQIFHTCLGWSEGKNNYNR